MYIVSESVVLLLQFSFVILPMVGKEKRVKDKESIAYQFVYIPNYSRLWQSSCGEPLNYCAWRSGAWGPRRGMFTALGLFYRRLQTGLRLLTVTTWWHMVQNIKIYRKKTDLDIITRNTRGNFLKCTDNRLIITNLILILSIS